MLYPLYIPTFQEFICLLFTHSRHSFSGAFEDNSTSNSSMPSTNTAASNCLPTQEQFTVNQQPFETGSSGLNDWTFDNLDEIGTYRVSHIEMLI